MVDQETTPAQPSQSRNNTATWILVTLAVAIITALGAYWGTRDNYALGEANAKNEIAPTLAFYQTQIANLKIDVRMPLELPKNIVMRYDFEEGINDIPISLSVCDGERADWYSFCIDNNNYLHSAEVGYTGIRSLGCRAELLPQTKQVYSIKFPLNPPLLVDAVTVNLYTEPRKRIHVTLAAYVSEEQKWETAGVAIDKTGWVRLLLDLRTASKVSQRLITEIHVDVFLPDGDGQSVDTFLRIDDLELYYFSSN